MTLLRCAGLCQSFGGVQALDGVDLELPAASIHAIIGPNGAGKTTLLNALSGFLAPDAGRVFLDGRDVTGLPPHRIAALGLVRTFQQLRVFRELPVLDNVLLARPRQRRERLLPALLGLRAAGDEAAHRRTARELLDFVGLGDKAGEPAGRLSYGQQKLLNLSCCLALEPRVLLLDEPVAGVHPEMIDRILGLLDRIREQGRLVVFVEHDMEAVRQGADRVVVLDQGRVILQGEPEAVLAESEILEAYLG
jgi:ABC-type branched-subunit amino acid transport system ATPase component